MLSGTYRVDTNALENIWFSGQADFTKEYRWRLNFEEYRPRNPYPTFRERFYTAYALGEQTLLKTSFHHRPVDNLTYYLGMQRATRDARSAAVRPDGIVSSQTLKSAATGYGAYIGAHASLTQWPGTSVSGEFDYLELGPDGAKSLYFSLAHVPSAEWRVQLNTALRFENKQLYGENQALGGELDVQYMIKNNVILSVAGSHIWNSRTQNEYLGAVQIIYYFDNFKPKSM
jgi:hypothetical protein